MFTLRSDKDQSKKIAVTLSRSLSLSINEPELRVVLRVSRSRCRWTHWAWTQLCCRFIRVTWVHLDVCLSGVSICFSCWKSWSRNQNILISVVRDGLWHRLRLRSGFPLGLENLENLEKWEGIFQSGKSQGILNRLEKSGKSQGKSHKILENSGNLR